MTIENAVKYAQTLYEGYEYKDIEREGEETEHRLVLKGNPNEGVWQELSDLMYQVNKETALSQDSTYNFTHEILGKIADSEATSEDELMEIELEPDVYTSNLTEWLNESNYHVEYLSEALQEYDPKDGFQALSLAQLRAMEDVLRVVVGYLMEKEDTE